MTMTRQQGDDLAPDFCVVPAGAVDATTEVGAMPGAAPLVSGACYKFSVITTDFKTGSFLLRAS